jgi:formamidopyrimidine-DNA glycosylase
VPEMPEIQAHAERLSADFAGIPLKRFVPLTFTALKTAVPAPEQAYGSPLEEVGRRGKYLLARFEAVTFAIHLMQGGRLVVDTKQAAKPRGGQARFVFDGATVPALLLTEQGSERRAGIWCVERANEQTSAPLDKLGPEAATIEVDELAARFAATNMRVHGFLRDQRCVAGIGRRLANEVLHRAKVSPFAMTGKLGADGAAAIVPAIRDAVEDGLAYERTRDDMSSSKDRPGRVHGRTGEACPVCGDTVREVSFADSSLQYCPTCQTGGKPLADRRMSRLLK